MPTRSCSSHRNITGAILPHSRTPSITFTKSENGKPVVIVSYGGHGGNKCALTLHRATEGLKMRPVATMPGIVLTDDMMMGGHLDPETDFLAHAEAVRQAVAELVDQLNTTRS